MAFLWWLREMDKPLGRGARFESEYPLAAPVPAPRQNARRNFRTDAVAFRAVIPDNYALKFFIYGQSKT